RFDSASRKTASNSWERLGCRRRRSNTRLDDEEEGRAEPRRALGPDSAAVPIDDALDDGEPDTAALELARRVQPLKRREELVRILHVEAGAVVAHEADAAPFRRRRTELDFRTGHLRGELPCVAEEVLEQNAQQPRVALAGHARFDMTFHSPVRMHGLQLEEHL